MFEYPKILSPNRMRGFAHTLMRVSVRISEEICTIMSHDI